MSKTYKFGIVGCGIIAPHHIESVMNVKNCEVTAVCDIVEEKARELSEKYKIKKIYKDYKDLVRDKDVDIVCICTPSGKHGEVAIAAANAKKHIFCEKPIEITKAKIDEMIKAVRDNGVKMACVFQMRTEPASIAVKKAIDEGKLGRIILADTSLKCYRSPEYYKSADWRGTWELDGGGALMNQGVHTIDMLLWIAGDVDSVFARAAAQVRNIEVEDTAVAVLKFKNGAFGVIIGATSIYPGQVSKCEIHGEKGTICFDTKSITQWDIEGNEDEKAPEFDAMESETEKDPGRFSPLSHMSLIEDFVQALDEGREPMIPPEEARKAVDLILAIYESNKTGKDVKLG